MMPATILITGKTYFVKNLSTFLKNLKIFLNSFLKKKPSGSI